MTGIECILCCLWQGSFTVLAQEPSITTRSCTMIGISAVLHWVLQRVLHMATALAMAGNCCRSSTADYPVTLLA